MFFGIKKQKKEGVVKEVSHRISRSGNRLYFDAIIIIDGREYDVPCAGSVRCDRQQGPGIDSFTHSGSRVEIVIKTLYFFWVPISSWVGRGQYEIKEIGISNEEKRDRRESSAYSF